MDTPPFLLYKSKLLRTMPHAQDKPRQQKRAHKHTDTTQQNKDKERNLRMEQMQGLTGVDRLAQNTAHPNGQRHHQTAFQNIITDVAICS